VQAADDAAGPLRAASWVMLKAGNSSCSATGMARVALRYGVAFATSAATLLGRTVRMIKAGEFAYSAVTQRLSTGPLLRLTGEDAIAGRRGRHW
jgi:hypothetical protein